MIKELILAALAIIALAGIGAAHDAGGWVGPGVGWYSWYSPTYQEAYDSYWFWDAWYRTTTNLAYLINGHW